MAPRWRILALLFSVRTAMSFQFASVGALAPLITETYRVDAASVGFLIGLYLSPGIVMALPGGVIGRALGDRRTVLAGLALMVLGGALSAFGGGWEAQLAGRLAAGVGGVVLNVVMSKMVADWFVGREIATAMAVFVNSWPVGIALALALQPWVAAFGGLTGAFALTALLAAGGFALLAFGYREAPGAAEQAAAGTGSALPRGAALAGLSAAAAIWGLYNGALAMIFSFAPLLLTAEGWSLTAASGAASLSIWCLSATVPFGGLLADRMGRPGPVIVAGAALAAIGLAALPQLPAATALLAALGLIAGLPAGPIMSLPARVLAAETRSLGMGLFFAIYYVIAVLAPYAAGLLIGWTGREGAAMELGAAMLVASLALLKVFGRAAARAQV